MATTQLLDGSIRICKVLTPNPRTEWQDYKIVVFQAMWAARRCASIVGP